MTPQRELFTKLATQHGSVEFGNHGKLPVRGRSDIQVRLGRRIQIMKDVLYARNQRESPVDCGVGPERPPCDLQESKVTCRPLRSNAAIDRRFTLIPGTYNTLCLIG